MSKERGFPENNTYKVVPELHARVNTAATRAYEVVKDPLAQESKGKSFKCIVSLEPPEGSRSPHNHVPGRLDGMNRTILNKVYSLAGARLADSITYSRLDTRTDEKIAEIVEVPVGNASRFLEITSGRQVDGSFISLSTHVVFYCNISSEIG